MEGRRLTVSSTLPSGPRGNWPPHELHREGASAVRGDFLPGVGEEIDADWEGARQQVRYPVAGWFGRVGQHNEDIEVADPFA